MNPQARFLSATPVLASLNIERSVKFFQEHFGFVVLRAQQGIYGVVRNEGVGIHFWACTDKAIAEATGCRLQVSGVASLYAQCDAKGLVHPRAHLEKKPWGATEFAVIDPDGNLITFYECSDALVVARPPL